MANDVMRFEETWELLDGAYRLEWRESWGEVTLSVVRAEDGKTLDRMMYFETRVYEGASREADLQELRGKLEQLAELYPNDVELLMAVSHAMGYTKAKDDYEVYE